MSLSQMLTDVKQWVDRGSELAQTHIPALVEWANKAENDPLVQAAIDLAVPPTTRNMLASLLKSVESDVQSVEQTAKAAGAAEATAPPAEQAPAEPTAAPA